MGHANRPEEEDKGYEGCSESEGESDVDLTSHPQVQLLWCTLYLLLFQLPFHYIVRLENTLRRKAVEETLMAEGLKALANFLLQHP